MKRAFIISVFAHIFLAAAVYWSSLVSIAFLKKKQRNSISGAIQVDLLYKPTNTAMKKGPTQKDRLPPPKVKTQPKPKEQPKLVEKVKPKKSPQKPSKKEEEPKKNFKNLFDKLRQETGLDREKPPKDDNFVTNEEGEKDSRGTGGESNRKLSPAELALQSAIMRYVQTPQAEQMRRLHPDARAFIEIRIIGIGSQLKLVSLSLVESSGFPNLDRSCETAIRKALLEESFASDVVRDLSGKEQTITCQF